MMITIRKSEDRGRTRTSWLNSLHTFSFGEYYDPEHMGFRSLRVINEDRVKPSMGFGRHAHKNMEIISYVIDGTLAHKDSMGHGSLIRPGDIQSMSAGFGIEHSEFNESADEHVHFLQIWIIPSINDLKPNYQQHPIPSSKNELILIGSPEKKINLIHINQDVLLYTATLLENQSIQYQFENGRAGWLQLIKGEIHVNGQLLTPGDGAEITEKQIKITSITHAEFLLFDLH